MPHLVDVVNTKCQLRRMGSIPKHQCSCSRSHATINNIVFGLFTTVEMSEKKDSTKWTKYAETYDPIKIGSIDGRSLIMIQRIH